MKFGEHPDLSLALNKGLVRKLERHKEFSIADCDNRLVDLNASYDELKAQILETGAASGMDIASMSALLEQNSNTRRLITQMVKAAHYLSELFSIVEIEKEPDVALAVSAG